MKDGSDDNPLESPEAAWLWRHLADFERKAIYRRDPNDLIAAMPGWMRSEARQRAGKLLRWLMRIRDGGDDGEASPGKCVTAATAQDYADGRPTKREGMTWQTNP